MVRTYKKNSESKFFYADKIAEWHHLNKYLVLLNLTMDRFKDPVAHCDTIVENFMKGGKSCLAIGK